MTTSRRRVFEAWSTGREAWNPFFCAPLLELGFDHLEDGTPSGGRVLDLGCGGGQVIGALAASGFRGVGVDIDLRAVAVSKAHHPAGCFVNASMVELPMADACMDALFAFSSFQYSDRSATLRECARVLRSGGTFIVVENLSANPIAVLQRWRTRSQERRAVAEPTAKVHLRPAQIREYESTIGPTTCEYFHLMTPILLVFGAAFDESRPRTVASRLIQFAYALLLRTDRWMLKNMKFLCPFAWQILITGSRAASDGEVSAKPVVSVA